MTRRRNFTVTLALAAPLLLAAGGACAQPAWPTDKPITMIVPFGAGGPADIYARAVGQQLSDSLKQPFVIENKPGAGAVIG
ncbi:MAG: tripartite tricarboxylate transporter substrate binding protein, partial [Chitinophagaceae bacterium]|nr:tripartite tricarboxylate transporter substrate binding protein [Rubrivivax sp.]